MSINTVKNMNTELRLPTVNHMTKTIVVSDAFARAAANPANNEFNILTKLRKSCPGYDVVYKAMNKGNHKSKKISYKKMRAYIGMLRGSETYLTMFDNIVKYSITQTNPYKMVETWFSNSFPDYGSAPQFDKDFQLVARVNLMSFEALEAACVDSDEAIETNFVAG